MHKLLTQLLEKRGFIKIEELTIEEKADFDRWNTTLNTEDITIENIELFIKSQQSKIEDKLTNQEIPKEQRLELLPYLSIYKALLGLIASPKVERELAEKSLQQLLNI